MNLQGGRPTDRTPTDFGDIIVGQLQRLGKTQSWLARGYVSHTCVSKWIYNEKKQITNKNVMMLSRRLKVPEEELLKVLGPRQEGVESRQKIEKPIEFERARAARAKRDLTAVKSTAKRPTFTKKESIVAPDGGSSNNKAITVIRSLLPQLSSEQRLRVLELILDRASIVPEEQTKVAKYIVEMLCPDL